MKHYCCIYLCINLLLILQYFRPTDDIFFDADLAETGTIDDALNDESTDRQSDEEELESDEEFFDCSEYFEIENEPTFTLPYKIGQETDPACLLLDKMLRAGKLSPGSYFYKNLQEVLLHLDNPYLQWDPEVCEALSSIKH